MKLAQIAASHWNGTMVRLISHRENAVYEMELGDGSRAALRQHRPGYQGTDSISDEMDWTAHLASQGFPCPRPLATMDGELLKAVEGQVFSAVSWVDATPIAEQDFSADARCQLFEALGRMLRQLHGLTNASPDLGRSRPVWSLDGLTGPNPLWGRYWETPPKGDPRCAILNSARDTARNWLKAQSDLDQGLIHADAIGENVLGTADDLWLIDFDDGGHGYLMFDLGVALTQHWDQDYLPDIAHAILAGYGADASVEDVFRFMTLRCLASAGWVQGRLDQDDPQRDRYINRAVECSQKYLGV